MKDIHSKKLKLIGAITSIIAASGIFFIIGQHFTPKQQHTITMPSEAPKQIAPDNLNKLINLSETNNPNDEMLDHLPIKGKATNTTISYQILTNEIQLSSSDIESYEINEIKKNYYGIQINLTDNGAQKLSSFTGSHLNKPCQFVINNKIISLSIIRSSLGKSFVIPIEGKQKAQDILNDLIN